MNAAAVASRGVAGNFAAIQGQLGGAVGAIQEKAASHVGGVPGQQRAVPHNDAVGGMGAENVNAAAVVRRVIVDDLCFPAQHQPDGNRALIPAVPRVIEIGQPAARAGGRIVRQQDAAFQRQLAGTRRRARTGGQMPHRHAAAQGGPVAGNQTAATQVQGAGDVGVAKAGVYAAPRRTGLAVADDGVFC